jgi:hypothetical protein
MARHTDGSLMTAQQQKAFEQAEFDSNIELLESLDPKDLYNTGPKYTRDGSPVTSFSPDRWSKYIDELEKRGEVEKAKQLADALAEKKAQTEEDIELDTQLEDAETDREVMEMGSELDEERMKIMPSEDFFWEEGTSDEQIAADLKAHKEGGPYLDEGTKLDVTWTDDDGVVHKGWSDNRGLKGNRDKDGNLITAKSDMAKEIEDDEKIEAEIEKDFAGGDDLDTTVAGWITQFKALSEEDFRDIDRQDLVPLGQNAVDAYFDVLDIHDAADDREKASLNKEFDWQGKAKGPLTDEERDTLVQEDVAKADAELDTELEDAESDRTMMEADADADKLDTDYEASEFPMMGMSDKDKGMFSFKKTESKDDKTIGAGIGVIVKDTGMNEEQARQLMTKLKGICG